jgi:NhaA family Na+:H+ antiporter
MTESQQSQHQHRDRAPLEAPVERLVRPLSRFITSTASSGILLLIAVAAALVLANSEWAQEYADLKHVHLGLSLGASAVDMSLQHWINDGFMVFFFFVLGLEIKREFLAGELRDLRQSSLVVFMAIGGMAMPALIYALLLSLSESPGAIRGWGIPMATDTAFALGLLALLGSRAPKVLAVLLSGIAILDDIGAVLVIGLFYTDELSVTPLFWAAICVMTMALFNLAGVRRVPPYLAGGLLLWWFVLQSGVHATTAGVVAALTVPARPRIGTGGFLDQMPRILRRFARHDDPQSSILSASNQAELAEQAREIAEHTMTPLQRWEGGLQRPVLLGIVPLFAFLNAGVTLPATITDVVQSPVAMATTAGLALGKPVGVMTLAWVGLSLGWARMPDGLTRWHLLGLGMLTGIGFTMSLFINSLAFPTQLALETDAKLGILLGSLLSALAGTLLLLLVSGRGDDRASAPD